MNSWGITDFFEIIWLANTENVRQKITSQFPNCFSVCLEIYFSRSNVNFARVKGIKVFVGSDFLWNLWALFIDCKKLFCVNFGEKLARKMWYLSKLITNKCLAVIRFKCVFPRLAPPVLFL